MKGRTEAGRADANTTALVCPDCGHTWASEAAFCGACGTKLAAPAPGRKRLMTPLPFLPVTVPAVSPPSAEGSGLLVRPMPKATPPVDFSKTILDAHPPVMEEAPPAPPAPVVSALPETEIAAGPGSSGTQRPTVEILAPGTRLGEFKVESFLGMGAMGTVYGATHAIIGRRVAIKVLRRDLVDNQEAVGRFVREAQAACRVRHANVIDVFTFGVLADGRAYFVMEWLDGETLRARLGRPLALGEVVGIVDQVIAALVALHQQQVVHRDLKPDNVHLTSGGVKLLDFGVAKLLDAGKNRDRLTKAGFVVGTAEYASPEQAGGHAVDERTDVYSLGVMLFELFTGRRPFAGASPVDLLVEHIASAPPRATSLRPTLPSDLDALVFGMMAKSPAVRPTLAEVRERLAPWKHSRMPVGVALRAAPDSRTVVDGNAMVLPPEPVKPLEPAKPTATATPPPQPAAVPPLPTMTPRPSEPSEAEIDTGPVRFAEPWHPERVAGWAWTKWALLAIFLATAAAVAFVLAR